MKLYHAHCWLLPEEKCFLRITLADRAVWLIPLSIVIDDMTRYYAEYGWYDQCEIDEGAVEPVGDELREHVYVNGDHRHGCLEMRWPVEGAFHLKGPTIEPPNDLLWAVDEQGGQVELMTTISRQRQRKCRPLLVCDVNPATL